MTAPLPNAMNQPRNSAQLAVMRRDRKVPALPVLISFVGPLEFSNVTLSASADGIYNWRIIAGLDVEIFVSKSVAMSDVIRHLAAIAAAVPKRMVVTYVEGPRVECGEYRIVRDEQGDFWLFDWFPMAVGPNAYSAGRVIEQQLWKAMASGDIPTPFDRARELVGEVLKEKNQCA